MFVNYAAQHVAAFQLTLSLFLLFSDHHVKEKDREKKREKNKEWKNHKLPPVHDIARENGEVISSQKGGDEIKRGPAEIQSDLKQNILRKL